MGISTCTLILALVVVLDSYELPRTPIIRRRQIVVRHGPNLDGSQEPVSRCISLLHYPPGVPPLSLLKIHVNGTYRNFEESATLLKRGNLIYGWNNAGVIDPLVDRNGRMIVLEGLTIRMVLNENTFRQRFGIGDRIPGPAAAC
ncbi:uncharacterized protein LOC117169675 [Belonocnema kinseyi]|uniref:uncharacterized protein LOC117169675 n=1 Tax=Belonocnema kinseyi TaxID=2817044 RepID=UPI00143DDF7F|nr:uncharacterized protein LOC117169675 [Belonocnema kinseyi]